jgi:subtilisin-like proprotein convertase family protein
MKRILLVLVAAVTTATMVFLGVASAQDNKEATDTTAPQNSGQQNATQDTNTTNGTVDTQAKKTKTFANTTTITIPSGAPTTTMGPAAPYPSKIQVQFPRVASGGVRDVNVKLKGLSHENPDDINAMLVNPNGKCVLFMTDAGGSGDVTNLNVTFDDQAVTQIPDNGPLTSGTFKPSNLGDIEDFPAPAPNANTCGSAFSLFKGTNPNGKWKLFILDDSGGDTGQIANGWSLQITSRVKP